MLRGREKNGRVDGDRETVKGRPAKGRGADNGGKRREKTRVSMIDRCQPIENRAPNANFTYGFARRKEFASYIFCRPRPFHHRCGSDIASIPVT